MGTTDGCAAQYKCANALYYQSLLAHKHRIVVGRNISEAGHGKSTVDAINGVDKNIIGRITKRSLQSADDALNEEAASLKPYSFNNSGRGEEYSAARDCMRVLQKQGPEGAQSDGLKRVKRHSSRGIH